MEVPLSLHSPYTGMPVVLAYIHFVTAYLTQDFGIRQDTKDMQLLLICPRILYQRHLENKDNQIKWYIRIKAYVAHLNYKITQFSYFQWHFLH